MTLDRDDIEAIADAVVRKLNGAQGVDLDAAYLASLSKADYDALMMPRMKKEKSK